MLSLGIQTKNRGLIKIPRKYEYEEEEKMEIPTKGFGWLVTITFVIVSYFLGFFDVPITEWTVAMIWHVLWITLIVSLIITGIEILILYLLHKYAE